VLDTLTGGRKTRSAWAGLLVAASIVLVAAAGPDANAAGSSGGPGAHQHARAEKPVSQMETKTAAQETKSDPWWLSRVNPKYKDKSQAYEFNCMECARTTAEFIEGRQAGAAAPYRGELSYDGIRKNFLKQKALIEKATGQKFKYFANPKAIEKRLKDAEDGAHGWVIGGWVQPDWRMMEHGFNVVNDNGKIVYLDGQRGVEADPRRLGPHVYRQWQFLMAPGRAQKLPEPQNEPAPVGGTAKSPNAGWFGNSLWTWWTK